MSARLLMLSRASESRRNRGKLSVGICRGNGWTSVWRLGILGADSLRLL